MVGTFVLCLIITSKTPGNVQVSPDDPNQPKVEKMTGTVKEIIKDVEFEMMGSSYAVEKTKYFLVVEPQDKDKIFRISEDACRPVIKEEEHKERIKKTTTVKKKTTTKKTETKSESEKSGDADKDELLRQLEN